MPDKLNRFGAARLTGQTTFDVYPSSLLCMTAEEVEVASVDNSPKMHHNERGKNVNKFVTVTQPFLLSKYMNAFFPSIYILEFGNFNAKTEIFQLLFRNITF